LAFSDPLNHLLVIFISRERNTSPIVLHRTDGVKPVSLSELSTAPPLKEVKEESSLGSGYIPKRPVETGDLR
jgi:hypothetical protein